VVDEDSFGGPQLAEQAHRITRLGFAVCLEEAPDHQEHGQEDDGIEKDLFWVERPSSTGLEALIARSAIEEKYAIEVPKDMSISMLLKR
jgi:hypothetical protein